MRRLLKRLLAVALICGLIAGLFPWIAFLRVGYENIGMAILYFLGLWGFFAVPLAAILFVVTILYRMVNAVIAAAR